MQLRTKNQSKWMSLGQKIGALRRIEGVGIEELMELLGVKTRRNYQQLEDGISHFTPAMIKLLAERFEVTEAFLCDDLITVKISDRIGKVAEFEVKEDEYLRALLDLIKDFNEFSPLGKSTIVNTIQMESRNLRAEKEIRAKNEEIENHIKALSVGIQDKGSANDEFLERANQQGSESKKKNNKSGQLALS